MIEYQRAETDDVKVGNKYLIKGDLYTVNEKGQLHSYNDQPARIDLHHAEDFVRKTWFHNGVVHRLNGPAVIFERTLIGTVPERNKWISSAWYHHGREISAFMGLRVMKEEGFDITEYLFNEDETIRVAAKKIASLEKGEKPLP